MLHHLDPPTTNSKASARCRFLQGELRQPVRLLVERDDEGWWKIKAAEHEECMPKAVA